MRARRCFASTSAASGASTGSYGGGIDEEEDARAALDFLEQRAPGVPLWMAGFSFGARVGLTVGAARHARPEAVRASGWR